METQLEYLGSLIEENYYDISDFLLNSTEEDRKEMEQKVINWSYEKTNEYLDSITFVNKSEVEMAMCEITEKLIGRSLGMGEMGDISEAVDDYISGRYEIDENENLIKK